jgi:hypothetical protein
VANLNLDGPRAKLSRGMEHERAFHDAINDYLSQRTIMLRLDEQPDGWLELILVHRLPIANRISTVYADMVQNLESALDLLVSQLVIANDEPVSSGNYMPVATSEKRWQVLRPDKLKGVSDEHADILKRHQPIVPDGEDKSAYNLASHPLVVIHEANRVNKHTLLTPMVLLSGEFEPEFQLNRPTRWGDNLVAESAPHGVSDTHIKNGEVIGRFRAESARGDLRITGLLNPDGGIEGRIGLGFRGIGAPSMDPIRYVINVLQPFEEIVAAGG